MSDSDSSDAPSGRIRGLFGFRRKQLLRGVRELTGWDAGRAGAALARAGVGPTLRPEALAPGDFVRLHHVLVDGGWLGD